MKPISGADASLLQKSTTQNPQSNPEQNVFSEKDLRTIRDNVRQQIRAGVADAQGHAGVTVDQAPPIPPVPPEAPRMITVRGSDGSQTVIGVPAGLASDVIPPQAVTISVAFFLMLAVIIIGLPIARAFSRRMDRRGDSPQIPNDLTHQIGQLNQAVDAIALEVERISEGQRFTTRLLSEQRDSARENLPTAAPR